MHRLPWLLLALAALLGVPGAAPAAGPPEGWATSGTVAGLSIRTVAADPAQPLRAVAVAETDANGGVALYETVDGGVTWRRGPATVDGSPVDGSFLALAGGAIWIVPSLGTQLCTAPGVDAAFTCVATAGLPSAIAGVPGQPGVLVSAQRKVVRRSVDGGATWTELPAAASTPDGLVVADPTTPGALYGVAGGRTTRSIDGGLSWTPGGSLAGSGCSLGGLAVDPHTAGRLYTWAGGSVCRSTDGGATWQPTTAIPGAATLDRVVATTDGALLASTGVQGAVYRSTDAGATWSAVPGTASHGLYGIAATASRAYVATDVGVFATSDGGATLRHASSGMATRPVRSATVVQPGANTVYALDGANVLRSLDGGATWEVRGGNVGQLLGVDRTGTLYAVTNQVGGGVSRSTDGGLTFETRGTLPPELALPFVISPADPDVMYVSDVDGHLIVSRDGGRSWANQPLPGTIRNFVADAGDPRRIYAAMKPPGGTVSRIAVSGDGGRSWKRFGSGADDYLLLASPTRSGVVVALAKTTLYVSTDGGRHFTPRLLGFFPKLYRDVGFVGTFAGDALVVSGAWGRERKLGVATAIQPNGGLLASGDLGRSWTWYASSLTSVAIGSVAAGDGQLLVGQRVLGPSDGGTPNQLGSILWRAPLPRLATRVRTPAVVIVPGKRRSLRCIPGAFAGQTSPTTTLGTDRNPGVLGLPPFQLRRQQSLDYAYACRTIARTPQGIALTTSPGRTIPRRRG